MSSLSGGRHINNVDLALLCNHSVRIHLMCLHNFPSQTHWYFMKRKLPWRTVAWISALTVKFCETWAFRFFKSYRSFYKLWVSAYILHPAWRFELISYVFSLLLQGSGEQSQELYTFHEAVSQLQDAEDKLVDDHRKNIEVNQLIQEPFESQPQLRQYGKKT